MLGFYSAFGWITVAVTLAVATAQAKGDHGPAAFGVVIRKEIRQLEKNPKELERYRKAILSLQNMKGEGGYQQLAGFHGDPDYYCPHHDPRFLPWHRVYLWKFEQSLQAVSGDLKIAIPYWDWTSTDSINGGIPSAFADKNCMIDGKMVANPLFSAFYGPQKKMTARNADAPFKLGFLRTQVNTSFGRATFYGGGFSEAIEMPHDALHGWVGGEMAYVDSSAYDPIFWSHHANIDRFWAQWQLSTNNQDPSSSLQVAELKPFGVQIVKTLKYRNSFGYDYEGITPMPEQLVTQHVGGVFRITAVKVKPTERVFLRVQPKTGIDGSFRVNVFVNQPEAKLKDASPDNPHYIGYFAIFGSKKKMSHVTHPPVEMELTQSFPKIAATASTTGTDLAVSFVVTPASGETSIAATPLIINGVSIKTR